MLEPHPIIAKHGNAAPLLTQLEEAGAYLFQKCALQLLAKGDAEVSRSIETIRWFESFAPFVDVAHIPAYLYAEKLCQDFGDPWKALHKIASLHVGLSVKDRQEIELTMTRLGLSIHIFPTGNDEVLHKLAYAMIDVGMSSKQIAERFEPLPFDDGTSDIKSRLQKLVSSLAQQSANSLKEVLDELYPIKSEPKSNRQPSRGIRR